MKLGWKIILPATAVIAMSALFWSRAKDKAIQAVEETRLSLRQKGFKTGLSDFDFSTSPTSRVREALLMAAGEINLIQPVWRDFDLLVPAGSNTAVVVWREKELATESSRDLWPVIRTNAENNREVLDAACKAAASGPIIFELDASRGHGMLLRHAASLKSLTRTLAARAMLELHDGNRDGAWTNLLALSRLVTTWKTEPTEISHLVRFACVRIAYDALWQGLQEPGWTEEQLARLQQEWESVEFFKGLPETAAFARACAVATCQRDRSETQDFFAGLSPKLMIRNPRAAWDAFIGSRRHSSYLNHGTFEDEKALLLHYKDREEEILRAIQSSTWQEMRGLPGVTNVVAFQSKYRSRTRSIINLRQIVIDHRGGGNRLLSRAAETESQRRLIVAAIALERHRHARGLYPATLQELSPDILKAPPDDFMDGSPLRYQLTEGGKFILHSVGLDCADNGGQLQRREIPANPLDPEARPDGETRSTGSVPGFDLVWPRPATEAEVKLMRAEESRAKQKQLAAQEEAQSEFYWTSTARRQSLVEGILDAQQSGTTGTPEYDGKPLTEVLRNKKIQDTDLFSLAGLLTPTRVPNDSEPEIVTVEFPIDYATLTNNGSLFLLIDPTSDEDSDGSCVAGWQELSRHTNGNTLLTWNTIYETPGKHALQAALSLIEPTVPEMELAGPITPFVVSNLCQFSLSSAHFDLDAGGTFRARLPDLNGICAIDLKTPAGELVQTLYGSTTNGTIVLPWDSLDRHGRKNTNEVLNTIVKITLPDSGRSQTMRGP